MDFLDNQSLLKGAWHHVLKSNAVALCGILLLFLAIAIGRKLTQDPEHGAGFSFATIWASRIELTTLPAAGPHGEAQPEAQLPVL